MLLGGWHVTLQRSIPYFPFEVNNVLNTTQLHKKVKNRTHIMSNSYVTNKCGFYELVFLETYMECKKPNRRLNYENKW